MSKRILEKNNSMPHTQKKTGSFYTPSKVADHIIKTCFAHLPNKKEINILEPSVGDGIFIRAILKNLTKGQEKKIKITAIDTNKIELAKAKKILTRNKSKIISKFFCRDFLFFDSKVKREIIIGNPPYIKENFLSHKQRKQLVILKKQFGIKNIAFKNTWPAFFLKALNLLTEDGIISFVLPAEFLKVNSAERLREHILKLFDRVDIILFKQLIFPYTSQDTIIIFCYMKNNDKGLFIKELENVKALSQKNKYCKINITDNELKWSNYVLTEEEINLLLELKHRVKNINEYCYSKPGIVTAANSYFIVNRETQKKYKLEKYSLPIIKRALYVNGTVVFDEKDFEYLESNSFPCYLLNFNNLNETKLSVKNKEYLNLGEELLINERYKCKTRKRWYVIPNLVKQPEGIFFKRSYKHPKLIKNKSNVYITDSGYAIYMKENFFIDNLIFSFYNNLTLLFAEISGRAYGDGVLELTPKEFKNLPLPYCEIEEKAFTGFSSDFKNKKNINELLLKNDKKILLEKNILTSEELKKINLIRNKITDRRLKVL